MFACWLAPSNIFQKIVGGAVNRGLCGCSDEYGTQWTDYKLQCANNNKKVKEGSKHEMP